MSVFLILVILVQRGRGGGLAGALGGMGGSSAFGTKSGDVFTWITAGCFLVWLCMNLGLNWLMADNTVFTGGDEAGQSIVAPGEPGTGAIDIKDPAAKPDGAGVVPVEEESDSAPAKAADAKPAAEEKSAEKPAPPAEKSAAEKSADAKAETPKS
ncbi:preprotein translocase subunit SecG [Kolteria novifilia]